MTRLEMHARARLLREELEARYKYGTIKIANNKGEPIETTVLQKELYSILYKLSKEEQ